MREPPTPRLRLMTVPIGILGLALAVLLAACSSATPSPTPAPTTRPTPTPVGSPVSSALEAAALVIAGDPRFAGAVQLDPDLIGQSKWWTASPLAGGGYTIEVTLGWGDCPAGCINRHIWTYLVTPEGTVTLASESGDDVPASLPE